jgi:hypothetical protein
VGWCRQRSRNLEIEITGMRSVLQLMAAHRLPRLFAVEEEYRLALREAELAWTRKLAGEIADGALSGTAEWAAVYAEGKPGELSNHFDFTFDVDAQLNIPVDVDVPGDGSE